MVEPTRRTRTALNVAAVHFRVGALNELQYRSNFVMQLLQSAFQIGTGLIILFVVYSKTDTLNGWTRPELFAAYGVFTLMGGIVRTFIQPAVLDLAHGIDEGKFDFVLTRPIDSQLLQTVRTVNVWQLVDVLVGVIIVGLSIPDLPSALSAGSITLFVVLLVVGVVIAYCMWFIVASIVFWVVKLPAMDNLFFFVGRAAQFPISIYPTWFRIGLTVIVPLGIAVTAPAEAVTSRLSWVTVVAAAGVMVVLMVVCRALWVRGVRRYSGASA